MAASEALWQARSRPGDKREAVTVLAVEGEDRLREIADEIRVAVARVLAGFLLNAGFVVRIFASVIGSIDGRQEGVRLLEPADDCKPARNGGGRQKRPNA